MLDYEPTPAIPSQPGDTFDETLDAPKGFGGRHWYYQYEVAGQAMQHSGQKTLPLDTLLTRQEMVDLDYALQFVDTSASLYAGRRYRHFGVVVITIGAFIGQPGTGEVRLEHFEPDKFISFAVECSHAALPVLSTVGKKAIDNLVDQALAEVIAQLRYQEAIGG